MNRNVTQFVAATALLLAASTVNAAIIRVEWRGTVERNDFINGPLVNTAVFAGDPVVLSFNLDSTNFLNPPVQTPPCNTRGYPLIPGSFNLRIGNVNVPLADPFPAGRTPCWVIRNNDQVADGVFLSQDNGLCQPNPVPVFLAGATGGTPSINVQRTFADGNSPNIVFPSIDIVEDVGYWTFEFISVFDMSFNVGAGTPLIITYEWFSMTRLSPPTVTTHPTVVDICNDAPVTFSITADNAASYQWQHDSAPLADGPDGNGANISGSATNTLFIEHAGNPHGGNYVCVVSNGPTNAAPYDTATSNSAALRVWSSCAQGDMNCDNTLDANDVDGFVQALLDASMFSSCNIHNGDFDANGTVDGEDIQPFVNLIVQ